MNKSTFVGVSNKTNILKARIFHIYNHGRKRRSKVSFFVKSSVRKLRPLREHTFKKKKKIFSLLVRSKQWVIREDGSQRKFSDNSIVVLKKNLKLSNEFVWGPIPIELRRSKVMAFFKNIY